MALQVPAMGLLCWEVKGLQASAGSLQGVFLHTCQNAIATPTSANMLQELVDCCL